MRWVYRSIGHATGTDTAPEAAAAEDAAGTPPGIPPDEAAAADRVPGGGGTGRNSVLVTSLGIVTFGPGGHVTGSGPASAGASGAY